MIQKFDSFKLKKAGDVKIITLKIDGKAVVIDQEYPRSTTWSGAADQLGASRRSRYVLLDHDYTTTDGRPADKIILYQLDPHAAGDEEHEIRRHGRPSRARSRHRHQPQRDGHGEAALSEIEAACAPLQRARPSLAHPGL